MHHGILIPPGVQQKLKGRMKSSWSDDYRLSYLVCSTFDDLLEDLNCSQFGLTKEIAKTYFMSTNSMPYGQDMDAACEELIKKYPESLRKMYDEGMRKKLGMLVTMLIGHMRVSDDRMEHHEILKDLMTIKWENPSSMVDVCTAIKNIQIRLKFKLNNIENYLRDDSDYDGLSVIYPSVIISRLETLSSMLPHLSPDRFKGVIAELDIIGKCVINTWRKQKMKISDYHKIACKWMTSIDMNDGHTSMSEVAPASAKESDIDPAVVIMTDMLHEAIAQYSSLPDFLIMPGVQSLLRWFVLERYILNVKLRECKQDEEPDSECDCPVSAETES